jgi:outer membrane protein OmpA-like peptidoglycan-associated protein
MIENLIESVRGMFTPETVERVAASTGESPEGIRRALNGSVPTIFGGLAHGASSAGGASRIFSLLTDGSQSGQSLMSHIFGDRSGAVTEALAKSSGVRRESASTVLLFAIPIATGVIAKQLFARPTNIGELAKLLSSHRQAIVEDPNTPPELWSALGAEGRPPEAVERRHIEAHVAPSHPRMPAEPLLPPASRGREVEPRADREQVRAEGAPRRSRWGAILPALVGAGLLVWGISALTHQHMPRVGGVTERQPTTPRVEPPPAQPPPAQPPIENPAGAQATPGQVKLPGDKTVDVPPDGPAAELAHDLGDRAVALPRAYHFDDLTFDTRSASATASSDRTLDNVATILNAYPSSRIRVEGNTDNAGDKKENQKLSESRARSIKSALAAKGVAADRIETSGKSQKNPEASNTSEDGRSRNRRVDIVLLGRGEQHLGRRTQPQPARRHRAPRAIADRSWSRGGGGRNSPAADRHCVGVGGVPRPGGAIVRGSPIAPPVGLSTRRRSWPPDEATGPTRAIAA